MKATSMRAEFSTEEEGKIGFEINNELEEIVLFRNEHGLEEMSFSKNELEFLINKIEENQNAN